MSWTSEVQLLERLLVSMSEPGCDLGLCQQPLSAVTVVYGACRHCSRQWKPGDSVLCPLAVSEQFQSYRLLSCTICAVYIPRVLPGKVCCSGFDDANNSWEPAFNLGTDCLVLRAIAIFGAIGSIAPPQRAHADTTHAIETDRARAPPCPKPPTSAHTTTDEPILSKGEVPSFTSVNNSADEMQNLMKVQVDPLPICDMSMFVDRLGAEGPCTEREYADPTAGIWTPLTK